jgi:Zn-dependent peptidase ImmA (M78 family)/transcriptional regulator with XRE-family HTH domain
MQPSAIGARIRAQREALGLSASAVAELSRVPVERLVALEEGAAPTVWELSSVAGALAVDPSSLRTGELDNDLRRSSARFRAPDGIDVLTPHDMRLLARVAEAARIHAFLRAAVGERRGRVEALRNVKALDSTPAWSQGYVLGKLARERLAPRREAIVSVQALLEEHGVLVLFADLETVSIAGASLYEVDASPTIVLNRRSDRVVSRLARRSVLAHELCHLLHDSTKRQDLLTVVSREKSPTPSEQRANGFAPSFLAPKDWVAESRGASAREKVLQIARTWGLTFDGAAWHAKNLKQISAKTAEELPRENLDAAGFEPEILRTPPSRIGLSLDPSYLGESALGDLAIRAAEADRISAGRAAEILTLA